MSGFDSSAPATGQFTSWNKIPRLKDRPPDPKSDESSRDGSNNLSSMASLKHFDTMQKNIEEVTSTSKSQFKASKDYFKKLGNLFKKSSSNKFFSASSSDAGSSNLSVGHTNVALQMSDDNNCEIIENFSVSCSSSSSTSPLPPNLNQKYASDAPATSVSHINEKNKNRSDSNLVCDLVDKTSDLGEAGGGASENSISNRPFLPWPNDILEKG
jgi:hypothetical protein